MVKINGSSFALQYKRTTGRPIDSTETFKTLEEATSYARNTDAEEYFPYPTQIISVESNESIYKLLRDDSISEAMVESIIDYLQLLRKKNPGTNILAR